MFIATFVRGLLAFDIIICFIPQEYIACGLITYRDACPNLDEVYRKSVADVRVYFAVIRGLLAFKITLSLDSTRVSLSLPG